MHKHRKIMYIVDGIQNRFSKSGLVVDLTL